MEKHNHVHRQFRITFSVNQSSSSDQSRNSIQACCPVHTVPNLHTGSIRYRQHGTPAGPTSGPPPDKELHVDLSLQEINTPIQMLITSKETSSITVIPCDGWEDAEASPLTERRHLA